MNQISFRKEPPLELPEGNLFKRMITCKVLAALWRYSPSEVAGLMWPNDRLLAAAHMMEKASSAPAMTSVAGWAKELVEIKLSDATDALGAVSSAIDIMSDGLLLSWDGFGVISVPAFVATVTSSGFVQEGNPIPVRQFNDTTAQILPYKVASISVLSREMMEGSNAEAFIMSALIVSSGMAIDAAFFDANASSASRPAGIRNGISATTASTSTDLLEAFYEDMAALGNVVGQVGGKGPFYLVGNVGRIMSAKQRFISEAGDVIPVISPAVGNDIIMIASQGIAAALDPDPDVEIVNAGTLVMDTAPGPAGVAGPERSLYQTDSFAIKVRWPVSWIVRDSRAVAWVTPNWK
jgi:hypothetical protein